MRSSSTEEGIGVWNNDALVQLLHGNMPRIGMSHATRASSCKEKSEYGVTNIGLFLLKGCPLGEGTVSKNGEG